MKLISMTDKVLELEKDFNNGIINFREFTNKTCNYANFLNQPLTLGMFVPCDEDGNVLEEPNINDFKSEPFCTTGNCEAYIHEVKQFQQEKDKVLFEGFEWNTAEFCDEPMLELENKEKTYLLYDCEDKSFQDSEDIFANTIEDLVKYNIPLTPNAIKQLKL